MHTPSATEIIENSLGTFTLKWNADRSGWKVIRAVSKLAAANR